MLSQTHKCGLEILISLGVFLKPLLAVTLEHVSHTDAVLDTYKGWLIWKCVVFFLTGKRRRKRQPFSCKRKKKLLNKYYTHFQGKQEQPGLVAICCQSCSRENTICLSQPMMFSSTLPHRSGELASYYRGTRRNGEYLLYVGYVWGRFQLYSVFTDFSQSSCTCSLMIFRDVLVFWQWIDATWRDDQSLHSRDKKTCRPF